MTRDLVAAGGFDALTIDGVARAAKVSRPVVYDLFGDLDGLVTALIDREQQIALAPLMALVGTGDPPAGTDPEQFLADVVAGFLAAVRADRTTWKLVLMPPQGVSQPVRRRFTDTRLAIADRVAELFAWGLEQRGGPLGLDHELLGRVVVAVGEDAARLTLRHPRRYSPERMAVALTAALAVLPPGAPRRGTPVPELRIPPAPGPEPAPPAGTRLSKADRREQLLDVALELIDEGDWDALSMDAIARRAGVDRVVVYRCYPKLELLTLALLRREELRTRRLTDAILPARLRVGTPAEIVGGAVARLLEEVFSRPVTYRVAMRRPESVPPVLQKVVNRRRAAIARRLRPLVELGLTGVAGPTEDIDVELLSRMLLSAGEELARVALNDPAFPPERVLAGAWDVLDRVPV